MSGRLLLAILGTLVAAAATLSGMEGDDGERERGSPAENAATRHDPVAVALPFPVLKTYRARFPGHQVWQLSQTGKDDDAEFEMIVFHPETSSAQGKQIGPAHVLTLMNYRLLLKGTGEVLQEQAHPIAEDAVPKAVKDAVDQWKRPLQGRTFSVEWSAHQEVGADRLYSVCVELNAIETYRATLKADGAFVKGSKAFEKYKSMNPQKGRTLR